MKGQSKLLGKRSENGETEWVVDCVRFCETDD